MKRGSLFFIGLISAIATFASLNYTLGRPGYYYERYPYYNHYHRCNDSYDRRYNDRYNRDHQQRDSTNRNY